jgi:hypothetical protein
MTQVLKPLPRHNPRRPTGPPAGQIVAVFLLLTFSLFPRAWILAFWIFGSELGDAYSSWIIPAAGFVVLPWTTVLYAWMWAISSDGVNGWEWLPVAVAFVVDLAFWSATARLFRDS